MPHDDELLQQNDETVWDWITWETRGNPSADYRRGDEAHLLGLWRADLKLLYKEGKANGTVKTRHDEPGCTGAGWIKILTLQNHDYKNDAGLIKTFLPFMVIDGEGHVVEPNKAPEAAKMCAVFPYNYDDNSEQSRAMGTDLRDPVMKARGAARLEAELVRWATASRSGIVAVPDAGIDTETVHEYEDESDPTWAFRPKFIAVVDDSNEAKTKAWKRQIWGLNPGKLRNQTFLKGYAKAQQKGFKLYSIKTGVQYVGLKDQKSTSKDLLEENSAHAMLRSDLISEITSKYKHYKLETRYQLEILCVQMYLGKQDLSGEGEEKDRWDGYQVRDLGGMGDEVWFPALAIPSSGKTFAESWGTGGKSWQTFWGNAFAEKLGRAKAEMLTVFGLQHMTANAQNMLVAFPRDNKGKKEAKAIILRDIGDTLLNDHFYAVLKDEVRGPFKKLWGHEIDSEFGVTLKSSIGQYFQPRITRLGTSIVFFFDPFMQGDLAKNDNTAQNVLVTWGILHNNAFVQFFIENLGFRNTWQKEEAGDPPSEKECQSILDRLIKFGGYSKAFAKQYGELVETILGLHSKFRWMFIDTLEDLHLEKNGEANYVDGEMGKKVVDAHDLLIGAEIQQFIRSDVGKKALLDFHRKAYFGG